MALLSCVEDVGDGCRDEVGVCVPVVGSSALGLPELMFGLGGLLGPISEFPVGAVYPVNVMFEPMGFVSPLVVRGPSISDSGHTTPTMAVQLRLRSRNSDYVYGSPPRRLPRCARLAQLLYSHFSRIPSIHSCHP